MAATPTKARPAWPALVLALGIAAAYAVFFAVPYYVNDLSQFPLDEVAGGAHDPKELWPFNTVVGGPFQLGAYLTMGLGPFLATAAGVWAVLNIWSDRMVEDVRRIAMGILTVAFAGASFAWIASPVGGALIGWMLD